MQHAAEIILAVLLFVDATEVRAGRLWGAYPGLVARVLLVYIPIIVVDAPIMQCHLSNESDDVLLEEVQSGILLHSWEFPDLYGPGRTLTRIHVVNVGALAVFIEQIKSDLKKLGAILSGHTA